MTTIVVIHIFYPEMNAEEEIVYIDWVEETHNLNPHSSIDIQDTSPQTEETPKDILLKLFPQQRIIAQALLDAERKGYVKTTLPPIIISNLIRRCKLSIGRFYTNMFLVSMKVGSGKTAIVFTIVAKQRVPEHRDVIVGIDAGHAALMYYQAERSRLPKNDLWKADLAIDWPAYFDEDSYSFPSYKPRCITRQHVNRLIPTNIFFIAPHLYEQMKGYCEDQVTFSWKIIRNRTELFEFLVEACINVNVFDDISLLIVPAEKYYDSVYYEVMECIQKARAELKDDFDTQRRLIAFNNTLGKARERSSYEVIYLWAYAEMPEDPYYFSRVFYDDYDSLCFFDCQRIPALTHVFISGTTIKPGVINYGFSSKLLYARYARIASQLAILPKRLEKIMNLSECLTKDIICTEPTMKEFVEVSLNGLYKIAQATSCIISQDEWDQCLVGRGKTKSDLSDILEARLTEFRHLINTDGTKELAESFRNLNASFHEYGVQLYTNTQPLKVTSIYTSIIRAYISYKLTIDYLLMTNIALQECITEHPYREMAGIFPLWRNYALYGVYPHRNSKFRELQLAKDDPIIGIQLFYDVMEPSSFDDIIEILSGNKGWIMFAIAPYLFRYIHIHSNLLRIRELISSNEMSTCKTILSNLHSELKEFPFPSVRCSKCEDPCGGLYQILSDCGNFVCYRCYEKVMIKTDAGFQCSLCGRFYENTEQVASSITNEIILNYHQCQSEIEQSIRDVRKSAYAPQIAQFLINSAPEGGVKDEKLYRTEVTGGKMGQIVCIVNEFMHEFKRPPRVLIYNETLSSAEQLREKLTQVIIPNEYVDDEMRKRREQWIIEYEKRIQALKEKDIESPNLDTKTYYIICEEFNTELIPKIHSGEIHIVVASSLQDFTGLNMQYLDLIIFYSPCRDEDKYTQVVGRALRTGREKAKKLYVYTLYYPSEQIERTMESSAGDGEMRDYLRG